MFDYIVDLFNINILSVKLFNFLWSKDVIRFHKSSFGLCDVVLQTRTLKLHTS